MGMSAQMTGNQFDIRVLTGMKSFNVKGKKTETKASFHFLIHVVIFGIQ